ncbi:MAG: hypothetical protein ACRDS1_00695 [Pseudonocardiaceae bacterium]
MISSVETSIEPPDLDQADEPDDEPQQMHLSIWLTECDGTSRNASLVIPGSPTDRELADALIRCVRGCAAIRGPGLVTAVERRIR